jgi:NAD(P)-dependent dehydrogenase (short-subunit alcohol dehydrogenase family)
MRGGRAGVAYHASKHAVIGLTRAAAREYAARGVRINAVCPGVVRTREVDRHLRALAEKSRGAFASASPLGRNCEPDEVASSVVWMCSAASSFMTGHSLIVDGGMLA